MPSKAPIKIEVTKQDKKSPWKRPFLFIISALFYAVGAATLVQALLMQLSFGINIYVFFGYLFGFIFFGAGKYSKTKFMKYSS